MIIYDVECLGLSLGFCLVSLYFQFIRFKRPMGVLRPPINVVD